MLNLGVTMADYQTVGGYVGQANIDPQDLADLAKALEAGEITGRETTDSQTASGAPLKTESLEKNLKVLTYSEADIVLWRRTEKLPAYNTVEEYNQLISYGADRGGFNNEGELPETEDTVYVRRAQLVKFLGVTKEVTHPMQLVNTMIGPMIQSQINAGTMWILRKANRAMAFGNEKLIPQEFNGLYAQHENNDVYGGSLANYWESDVLIDLRGDALGEAQIEEAANAVIENFGYGNLLMAPPRVLSDFVKGFYGNKFIQPGAGGTKDGVMGQSVKTFASQFGDVELGYDKFLRSGVGRKTTDAATHPTKAPAPVTIGSSNAAATVTDTANLFGSAFAGSYYYAVAAGNRYGESQLTAMNTADSSTFSLTVASTQSVNLTFSDGGGTVPASFYTIYRSKKNPGTSVSATVLYPLFSVSIAERTSGYDGGSAGVVRDRNRRLPDTNEAFFIQGDTEVFAFKQLAPLMKMDLAILGPSTRFMILLYGTPQLYAPKKMVRFVNIGML